MKVYLNEEILKDKTLESFLKELNTFKEVDLSYHLNTKDRIRYSFCEYEKENADSYFKIEVTDIVKNKTTDIIFFTDEEDFNFNRIYILMNASSSFDESKTSSTFNNEQDYEASKAFIIDSM